MRLIITLFLFVTPLFCNAAEKPLKTFLLIGQSNMVGKRCQAKQLEEHLKNPQKDVLYFHDKEGWIPIAPGKTEPKGFGPELSFGHEMQKILKEPIGIIKHSIGGTSLGVKWNPKDPKSLYHFTLKRCEKAAKAKNIKIVGIVWVQGGADAKTKAMADAYAENYKNFIAAWSRDLNNDNIALICGRCGTTSKPEQYRAKKPHIDIVRKAQDSLDYKLYTSVDLDDVSLGSDGVHFDTKGMVETGVRYAKAMDALLKKTAKQSK